MKRRLNLVFASAAILSAAGTALATDGTWTGAGGFWSDYVNWSDSIIAGNGGVATFAGSGGTITIQSGLPFTLSEMRFNPTGTVAAWYFEGETNTLVAPALVAVNHENVFFRCSLAGSDGLHFTTVTDQSLPLTATNLFTGRVLAENGRLLPNFDHSLGAVPPVLTPSAVVLSNAVMGNYADLGVNVHANRGIEVVENGYFHGRNVNAYLRLHCPITGDGNVWILRQSSFMEFTSPASDYTGDTIFGGTKIGYYNATVATATLRLGADEVIPHGAGRGRLLFQQGMNGILDLQGHDETVNSMGSDNDGNFTVINSAETPGALVAGVDDGDMRLNGLIGSGATLVKSGGGTLRMADSGEQLDLERGALRLVGGALDFTDPALLGSGTTLQTDGGALRHGATQPGLIEHRGASSGTINFAAPLTATGVRLSPRTSERGYLRYPNNTQYRYSGQWFVPVAGTYSFAQSFDDRCCLKIDDVEIMEATNSGSLTTRQGVYLDAGWHDIEIWVAQGGGGYGPRTPEMSAALMCDPTNGDFSTFDNAIAFQDPGGGDLSVIFDATRETDARLIDDPEYLFSAANQVVLSGSNAQALFTGAGTIDFDGSISGTGALVKEGTGTAILHEDNDFVGAVTLNAGNLIIDDEAQLGDAANVVAFNGGALSLDYSGTFSHTLATTGSAVLEVKEGQQITYDGNASGQLVKAGGGQLTLDADNPLLDLHVLEGLTLLAAAQGPTVRSVVGIETGAVVRLAGGDGNQIDKHLTLSGGTFDLAGYSESIGSLGSLQVESCITNSSATRATLTVGENNQSGTYLGSLGGAIDLVKTDANWLAMSGAATDVNDSLTLTLADGSIGMGLGIQRIRFVVRGTRTSGSAPSVSEFQITRHGRVVPWPAGTTVTGTPSGGGHVTANVIANDTRIAWLAGATENQYFTIHTTEPVSFDGYRWYTGATTVGNSANDPIAWDVHVSTTGADYFRVDAREVPAAAISTQRGILAGHWTLTEGPISALKPAHTELAADTVIRVHLPNHAIGALAGTGELDLRPGVVLAVGDLTDFGGLLRTGKGSALALTTTTPIALDNAIASGLTVSNATDGPLAAIIGTQGETSFFGTLKDGLAPLKLVKRGSGTLTLADAGSAYSGDTLIESGAIMVAAGAANYRYVRFNVLAEQDEGKDNYNFEMAYGEFQLLRGDSVVPWPAGTVASATNNLPTHAENTPSRAIDGNVATRWLSGAVQPLTVDTQTGVTFDGYRIYSSANSTDRGRAPKTWLVEGNHDGVNWQVLDGRANVPLPPGHGILIGTYKIGASTLETLPTALWAQTPATNRFLAGVRAKYLRYTVTQTRREGLIETYNDGFQLSELQLLKDGVVVPWPEEASASAPGGQWPALPNCNPSQVINNTATGGEDRWLSDSVINPLTIVLPSEIEFDAYQWITAHNTAQRDPIGWRLEASADSNDWHVVDERYNTTVTEARLATVGPFTLELPANGSSIDALPDNSRVIIAADASLKIGSETIETIGPVSGGGDLELGPGAIVMLNLFEDATFDGALSGSGATLVLGGEHTQTFTTLTTVAGALTVDFAGGKFGGLLRVGSALTITGAAAFPLPDALPARIPLFTFGTLDNPSRTVLTDGAAAMQVPEGYVAKVVFTENSATLSISAPGLLLLIN